MSRVTNNSPKRACDGCHRRKVKCIGDGLLPCDNCRQSNLLCTYHAIPKKKGPKGSRAKVISGLRDVSSLSPLNRSLDGISPTSGYPVPSSPPNLLPTELIEICLEFFFSHFFPTQPILDRDNIRSSITNMYQSVDDYCLVTSLCAYMLIQPSMHLYSNLSSTSSIVNFATATNMDRGKLLLRETHRARRGSEYVSNPTTNSIITSFFLFGSEFCLELPSAYFYLREATTLVLLLGMDKEQYYIHKSAPETEFRRRLFWLLFVTERAYALQTQKPLSLHSTIALPQVDVNSKDEVELDGFIHLVNLFKPFDDTFVRLWNHDVEGCTAEWASMLQRQLSEVLPPHLRSTEIQAVDLKISQQWLRTMVWQLSISNRLLSSSAINDSMTFTYPIVISRALVFEASQFCSITMDIHGIGLTKKIFDIACTLVDVLSIVPIEPQSFNPSPRDSLNSLFKIMFDLRGGQDKYVPLLLEKVQNTFLSLPGGNTLHGIPPSIESLVGSQNSLPAQTRGLQNSVRLSQRHNSYRAWLLV